MIRQEPYELLHLLIDRQPPMVVAPDVLGQVVGQARRIPPPLAGQPAFR